MPKAFISHSSPDDRYVQEFVQLVRSFGYAEVFNDSHTIEPDEEFWPRIEKGIRECDAFAVILSHASVKSYWVDQEVQYARQLGKKVIPIRIDDCKLPACFDGRDVIELRQGRGEKVKFAPTRLTRHAAAKLFGREKELELLDRAWNEAKLNLLTIVAWGGVGKTSLVTHWVNNLLAPRGYPGVERAEHQPETLAGLAPLYQAVVHGCLAGRQQEACDKVYYDRILRGTGSGGFYSGKKLGAFGADLAAVAAFFDEPWSRVAANLGEADQAWLLNEAATRLRALGRLTEALPPMRAGLQMAVRQEEWKHAAVGASNLSELELTLGRLPAAVADACRAVAHADQSDDASRRMSTRTAVADVLHQCGQRAEAGDRFAEAERMQKEWQPEFDLLYSLGGFRYCDWLLAPAERAAWQAVLAAPSDTVPPDRRTGVAPVDETADVAQEDEGRDGRYRTILDEVERRASTTLKWVMEDRMSLMTIALDHLTVARVGLFRAIRVGPLLQPALALPHVASAVNALRAAGQMNHVPCGLLTAAVYHLVRREPDLARQQLADAQQIAQRGPMPLFLADVHLHRARMFRDRNELAKAAKLIRDLGYGRRFDELADA